VTEGVDEGEHFFRREGNIILRKQLLDGMKGSQRQTLRMQQKLLPQQIMLMRLLQMSVTTLQQSLKEEMEKNPLLEPAGNTGELAVGLPADDNNDDGDENLNFDSDDYRERVERDRNVETREPVWVSELSPADRLMEQLDMKELTPRQRQIAQEVVGSIDDSGYLGRDVLLIANDLAFTQGIEATDAEVLEVLEMVQNLDPPGIAARNLQECLSLQLHRWMPQDDVAKIATRVIDECFGAFVGHNYGAIMVRLSIDDDQLQEAIDFIRRLNPKPGVGSDGETHAQYIVPDIIVTRQDDHLMCSVNDGQLPQLHLCPYYNEMLQGLQNRQKLSAAERETVDFLSGKRDNATMLIEGLQQRHQTMMRVMQVILRRQHRFFLTGNSGDLQPLLQKDVAQETGLDLSTISRVVNSKYVQTEFGTILLKQCFTQAITNEEGEEVATEAVRKALAEMVEGEDKHKPLSDEELSQQLKEQGFPVARRTVAKYREMLDIPVSRMRRQLKVWLLMATVALGGGLAAQQPEKPSYFDSVMNARIREGKLRSRMADAKGKGTGYVKGQEALEVHDAEPEPTAIDTLLAQEEDLPFIMYDFKMPPPAVMWYGNQFSGALVRVRTMPMDSLPDEITIRLLKENEQFCFPIKNVKTSNYGWRWNRPHRGVDIRLNTGDPVRAVFNGVVRVARPMGGYGNLVVLRHYNGLETVYGHLSKIGVKAGQVVRAGQTIGLGGSTGHSTGPHLHFEVRFQYEAFDPEWLLDFSNYSLRTRSLYLDKTYFGIRKPHNGEEIEYKADKSIVPEVAERKKGAEKQPRYAVMGKEEKLSDLADRYHTTTEQIKALNPNIKKFRPGVKIRVK